MDRSTQLAARPTALPGGHPAPPGGPHREHPRPAPDLTREGDPAAESLHLAAAQVLRRNRTGSSTVPSRGLYPHQWSWDSAFIAVGLRHLAPGRAQAELETLLAAQWGDGRVPHIVFNPAVPLDAYFPSPDFWRSSTAGRAAGAPAAVETSGIVQPPVHALAVWLVHCADPGLSRARGFLHRLRPRLAAWHDYLLTRRDAGGHGLASVLHPWEQGMDNSPCWDGPLSRVEPAAPRTFRRADLDHGAVPDRPTDLDYGRYVRLAADYRDGHYTDGARDFAAFAVEDPAFNALLIASEHALARIARELGDPRAALRSERRAAALTRALLARLWSPRAGMFLCRDLSTGALVPERSVAGLVPLILPRLPAHAVDALVATLRGEHFALGAAARLVPSYDLVGHAFEPRRYWRGPAWFNTAWLLERGLRLQAARRPGHGALRQLADALGQSVRTLAPATGFAEYVDARTGEGLGARGFGWTAALALDLLHDASGRGGGGAWDDPRDRGHREEPER
ncbi:MGH1-like glycoside hydrolase domain-containing protein [Streptomyces physcomitrii]|uniref:MGH1-like glycoside hydrolase domain-containing protein n=1 Tax=Streptomyces physcomitrii TaxID=2724184 RepID=UPI003F4D62BB